MNFAIYGVNFVNKGAELMLNAVKQQVLEQWSPENVLACHLQIGTFAQRKATGVNHLAWRTINKIPVAEKFISPLIGLIPKAIREYYSIILESEVEVIFDASGFAYSDQWGFMASEKMAQLCLNWKQQNKKIILLPQAFGPFTNARVKKAFIQIIENSDLIFARDEISYQYITELAVSMDHVKIAPDFTNLVQGIKPSYLDDIAGKCCIVPNQRMLDKTSQEVSKAYISLLVSGIKYLQLKGLEAFILIHEENDIAIANILQSKLDQPILMIKETNPLILKGILGNCYLVIGSRFHSLISAFSQGVPCVGAGWSHKYKILFKDYGCSNLLVNLNNNSQKILDLLDLLINETKRTEIIQNINYNADIQKTLARQMWDEVRAELS